MNRNSTITITTDPETKKTVKNLFGNLGMSVSEAVNLFFSKSISENKIPFKVKKKSYHQFLLETKAIADEMKKNPQNYKSFTSIEELLEDLESDDDA